MPIPSEHIKERLSVSCVSAIAAKAGVACRPANAPEYGTDVHLVRIRQLPNGKYAETGWILNCQIKSTTTNEINDQYIIYDMEVEDYNKLATWEGGSPCVLLLVCLPKDPQDWLGISEEQLVIKHCCYWTHITDPPSSNQSRKRVFIPRSQVFTPDTVNILLDQIKSGGL